MLDFRDWESRCQPTCHPRSFLMHYSLQGLRLPIRACVRQLEWCHCRAKRVRRWLPKGFLSRQCSRTRKHVIMVRKPTGVSCIKLRLQVRTILSLGQILSSGRNTSLLRHVLHGSRYYGERMSDKLPLAVMGVTLAFSAESTPRTSYQVLEDCRKVGFSRVKPEVGEGAQSST